MAATAKISAGAIYDHLLKGSDLRVLAAIISQTEDGDDWVLINQTSLAQSLGLSRASVSSSIKRLLGQGHLVRRSSYADGTAFLGVFYAAPGVKWEAPIGEISCFYCGTRAQVDSFEKEHKTPRSLGGGGASNIVDACRSCNRQKGVLDLETYRWALSLFAGAPVQFSGERPQ